MNSKSMPVGGSPPTTSGSIRISKCRTKSCKHRSNYCAFGKLQSPQRHVSSRTSKQASRKPKGTYEMNLWQRKTQQHQETLTKATQKQKGNIMANNPTPPTPDEVDFIERRVWNFSRSPDEQNQNELYVHPNTMFNSFKEGKITDLSFHMNGLTGPALTTDIELLAAHLHLYLDGHNISPIVDSAVARGAVRDAASDASLAIQDLLDAVVANYREN